jgi:peptidoglycan/xylan/chitin deacetylase (PgdA/CDA1 family)
VLQVTSHLGYKVVNWNLDTNDWQTYYSTGAIMDALYAKEAVPSYGEYKRTRRGSGMSSKIVLMHDRPLAVQALSSVISFYSKRGYSFVNMEKCLGISGYF